MTAPTRTPPLRGLAHFLVAAFGVVSLTLGVAACSSSPTDNGGCSAGQKTCGGTCTDTTSDPANCGACGHTCPTGEVCSKSACALTCGGGTTECSAACVDTNVDPANCGKCGNACAAGEVCSQGTCGVSCGGSTTECSGACVDTNVDPANCGGCGKPCAAGEACVQGTCSLSCGGGSTACGGACVDTNVDPANCGKCNNPCAAGDVCVQGTCALSCVGGTIACNGACVDTNTDPANCGGCGKPCAAGEVCSQGTCALSCGGGTVKCGSSCVDTQSDPTHCGTCTGVCGANQACTQGTCQYVCSSTGSWPEYACDGIDENCNGIIDDGCPKAISAPNTTVTLQSGLEGDPAGGTAFGPDVCPAGDVAVGIYGAHGGNIDRFGLECAPIGVAENNGSTPYTYAVTTGAKVRLPLHGTNTTTPYEVLCPAGQILTRIDGYYDAANNGPVTEGVHQLSVYCSAATLTGTPTKFTLAFGTPTLVGTVSSTYNLTQSASFTLSCPGTTGYVGAVSGRSGAWVDALKFACYSASLTLR